MPITALYVKLILYNPMSEKPPQKRQDSVHYTRHGRADYKTYAAILGSDNPRRSIDPREQVPEDLNPEARVAAKEAADAFLNQLNPETDDLFFVSSSQVRALETAAIYRDAAREKGFEILKPGVVRDEVAQGIGGEDIRVLQSLSLHSLDALVDSIFNPDRTLPEINWDAIDAESREKWERAHRLIQEDDKGSWGANMFHHGEKVKEIFPEVDTALELYNGQFKNLVRLIEFAQKKIADSGHPKNVKVLAFGHENYVSHALATYFGEHEIKNCETITFEEDEQGSLVLTRRGETKPLQR